MEVLKHGTCESVSLQITYKMFNKSEDPNEDGDFNQSLGFPIQINLNSNELKADGLVVDEGEDRIDIFFNQAKQIKHEIHNVDTCVRRDIPLSADFKAKVMKDGIKHQIGCE